MSSTQNQPGSTENMERIQESLRRMMESLSPGHPEEIERIIEKFTEYTEAREAYLKGLLPALEAELSRMHAEHPETADITAKDIDAVLDLAGGAQETEAEIILNRAGFFPETANNPALAHIGLVLEAVARAKAKYEAGGGKHAPIRIPKAVLTEIRYPLDKVSSMLWGTLERGIVEELKAETDSDNTKGKTASIRVLFDFDDLPGITLSKQLGPYDKRVFIAAANLVFNGHSICTAAQIYRAMGCRTRPSAEDREKILQSLENMARCRVSIDNTEEAQLYTKYERIKGSFYLLPTEILQGCEINGRTVDDAVRILEPPALFSFALSRGHITTAPIALLESPISKTDANLRLEDYLFTRTAHMRNNPKLTRTILLETVCEKTGVATRMQKSRLPERIRRILDHYTKAGWIASYKMTDRDIRIKI